MYGALARAPALPLGRLPFVVAMKDDGSGLKSHKGDMELMKRVRKFNTLKAEQKGAIKILLSQKYSLMERAEAHRRVDYGIDDDGDMGSD